MAHPYFADPGPMLFGHRGASGELPENTLPAFERALEQGATAIETDVHLSRDGEVMVFHDDSLDRTTDATGAIAELTCEQIQALDAGHGFSADGGRTTPHRGRGFRVPRLAEAFQAFPEVSFNIEIKAEDEHLIEAVLDLIADRADRTLVAAATDPCMARLRAALARRSFEPAMGASLGDVVGYVKAAIGQGERPTEPMALQIPPMFSGRPLVTPELISFAHEHGVHVHVWTINERAEMRRLLDLGVDGVMSDFPGTLVEVARG